MINLKILKPKIMKELKEGYAENNPKGIQISGFFAPECYRQTLKDVSSANFKKNEQRDTHSYYEASHAALSFFNSKEFLRFASSVAGKKLSKTKCTLKIFLTGSYTLLHDQKIKGVEFYLDMTASWKQEWGGSTFFVTKGGEKLMLPPTPNTLTIAKAGNSYVKYVNSMAKSGGRFVVHGIIR